MLHNEKTPIHSLTFTNSMLQELAMNLLADDFRVYVFQERNVSQIFFEDQDNRIGTCSDRHGYLAYSTVHLPNKQSGTGFMIETASIDTTTETARRTCRTAVPFWGSGPVTKWSSFKAKASKCILTYRELTLNREEEN